MAENKNKTVLFLSNHFITLYNFRRELIERLCSEGYDVVISQPEDERNRYFEALGCRIIPTPMSRHGMNPVEDMKLITAYRRLIPAVDPHIIFSYTIKPNVYGAIALSGMKYRQVCNITGTGATFLKEGMLSRIARMLYRLGVKKAYKVFFQNSSDRDYFVSHRMVGDNYAMLPGSGVNLQQHSLHEFPPCDTVNFIYIGRIVSVKGIRQYLDCAGYIRAKYPNTCFYMAGFIDDPAFETVIPQYHEQGVINYLGFCKDIGSRIQKCHCTILPSLGGEGVPNVLLESAATGRVCIASDIPGSRDVVEDGVTGYLFTPGSSQELIQKVEEFLSLSDGEKAEMGLRGRRRMEEMFDREQVISAYMQEVRQ